MNREARAFWSEVRQQLLPAYGQSPGKRDRGRAALRRRFADELRIPMSTLKGFLNGHQKTLGEDVLPVLFSKIPDLEGRYPKFVLDRATSSAQGEGVNYIAGNQVQITLKLEGSDEPAISQTARLPPGRAGILTVKVEPQRVA